jgi:hypothetical protein
MKLVWLLQDVHNFLHQFLPSPLSMILRYRFSPADLAHCSQGLIDGESTNREISNSSAGDNFILHTFDVLSYNINNVAAFKPSQVRLILRAIFSSGAGIVMLQESNPAWEKLLLDDAIALEYNHRYFHHPRNGDKDRPPDRSAGGIAILSRFPLEEINVVDFTQDVSGSVFPALVFKALLPLSFLEVKDEFYNTFPTLTNESIICIGIANVHLRPPVNLDGSAWFDTARKTEPIRLAEVKSLVRCTMSSHSLDDSTTPKSELDIIAGDFNEDNFGAALSYLSNSGYKVRCNLISFLPFQDV